MNFLPLTTIFFQSNKYREILQVKHKIKGAKGGIIKKKVKENERAQKRTYAPIYIYRRARALHRFQVIEISWTIGSI